MPHIAGHPEAHGECYQWTSSNGAVQLSLKPADEPVSRDGKSYAKLLGFFWQKLHQGEAG